jgi:hypothetical protein
MSINSENYGVPSRLTIMYVDLMDRSPEKPTFPKAPTRSAASECRLLSLNSYGLKRRFNGPIIYIIYGSFLLVLVTMPLRTLFVAY